MSLPPNPLVHPQQLEADMKAQRQGPEKTLKFSLSALSQFPTEMLCHIFQCCVDGDRAGDALTMRAMPWVLSQICRAWREVVISTPSLWRVIRIDMGEYHVQDPVSLVQTYLARSQPLPISCMLNLQDSFEPADRVVKTIMADSERLQDIDFDLGSCSDIYIELVRKQQGTLPGLPLLHSFRMVVSEFAEEEDDEDGNADLVPDPVYGQFSLASSLIEAHIEFPVFGLPLVLLPWEQLTELYCPFHNLGEMEEVARGVRNVVNWYMDFRWDDWDMHNIHAADEPVLIPHLRHLNLRGKCCIIGPVLNRFVTPSLEDLALYHTFQEIGSHSDADGILTAITRLQTRSCCTLRRLTAPLPLFSTPTSTGLHSVEELHTSLPVFNTKRRLYSEAFANMKKKSLLAGMRTLHLDLQRASEARSCLVFQSFLDVASTRCSWDSSSRLERLSFWANNRGLLVSLDSPSVEKLSELRKDGMVMLGDIIDGAWCSTYKNLIWKSDITKEERRSMRFLL